MKLGLKESIVRVLGITACLGLWLTLVAGRPAEPEGAKELFYDPAARGSVVSVDASAQGACASYYPARNDGEERRGPDCPRRQIEAVSNGAENAGLSYWIELVEGSSEGVGRQVTESRIFRSGEKIRLHFLSNCDGEIALFQLGSSGEPSQLFPDSRVGLTEGAMRAGVARALPEPDAWFRFDHRKGTERIMVVFVPEQSTRPGGVRPRGANSSNPTMLALARLPEGSKDLVIEREDNAEAEIGTYAVNPKGEPVVLEIALRHE